MRITCPKCQITFEGDPLDNFYANRTRASGLGSYCKKCTFKAQNRSKKQRREKRYYESNKNKVIARDQARKYYKGRILYCAVYLCMELADELHHVDYSQPLAIIPLCKLHHKMNHDVTK